MHAGENKLAQSEIAIDARYQSKTGARCGQMWWSVRRRGATGHGDRCQHQSKLSPFKITL